MQPNFPRMKRRSVSLVVECPLDARSTSVKEGNVLFNDALNTFYLRLYGVKHMVKDHSDSERGNLLLLHGLLFLLYASDRITHTTSGMINSFHVCESQGFSN